MISDDECDIEVSQQLLSRGDVNVDSIDKMFATAIVDDKCNSSVDVDFETRPVMEDRNNPVKESKHILDDFSYENPSTEKLLQIILNSLEILEEILPVKGTYVTQSNDIELKI